MESQAIVLALQILLLTVGWALFQKARADLSAQAAQTPVLGEVKALQRNVRALLAEIEATGAQTSRRLEQQCADARELLARLEARQEQARSEHISRQRSLAEAQVNDVSLPERANSVIHKTENAAVTTLPASNNADSTNTDDAGTGNFRYNESRNGEEKHVPRRETVYRFADSGLPPEAIAQNTGLSEGEVETLLGLRARRSG